MAAAAAAASAATTTKTAATPTATATPASHNHNTPTGKTHAPVGQVFFSSPGRPHCSEYRQYLPIPRDFANPESSLTSDGAAKKKGGGADGKTHSSYSTAYIL